MRTKCRSKLQETEEYGVECGSQFSNKNQAQGSGGKNNECSNAWMELRVMLYNVCTWVERVFKAPFGYLDSSYDTSTILSVPESISKNNI